jgi:hypothetical protein
MRDEPYDDPDDEPCFVCLGWGFLELCADEDPREVAPCPECGGSGR